MNRQEKKQNVSDLHEVFDNATIIVATHYKGLSVAQMEQLRNRMKDAGAMFKVTKNRLAKRALENSKAQGLETFLSGPVALAWSEDAVTAPKILKKYANENDKLILIGGIFEGKILNGQDVKNIADLPSLDELRAKILAIINAPATKIANIITQPATKCVRAIKAYAEKEKKH